MNCAAARRAMGAEPNATSPELDEHLRTCPACEEYRREMRMLDENIRRALLLDIGSRPELGLPPREAQASSGSTSGRPRTAPRRFALAASALIAVAAGLLVWTAFPRESLAKHVVEHMQYEPEAWTAETPAAQSVVEEVLRQGGVEFTRVEGEIVYARTCFVKGRWVPHFVVRTDAGPVTLIVMPDEHVSKQEQFDENGFTGVVLPAPKGSIAVLTRGDLDPQAPAQELLQSLRWRS